MGEQFVQHADPEELFTVLADETRLAILAALWESDDEPVPFSELYSAVDIDDSGHFNYHLDKITGRFITKTDGGYALTQAGKHVNGALASGVYTTKGALEPVPLDASCRMCGGERTLQYEDEVVRVECASCPADWVAAVPPAVLAGYDRDEIPRIVSRYLRTKFRRIVAGFCTYCDGRMERAVGPSEAMEVGPDASSGDQAPTQPVIQFDCQRCGATAGLSLTHGLLFTHPAVISFYHDHGIDLRERLIWDIPVDPDQVTLDRRDPVRASVTFRVGDAERTVTVDETFSTVDIDR